MTIKKISKGMYILTKGHPPSGEKLKVIGYAYTPKAIKKLAKNYQNCHIYQLKYSVR